MIALFLAALVQAVPGSLEVVRENSTDYRACYFTGLSLTQSGTSMIASLEERPQRRHQAQYHSLRPANRQTVPLSVEVDLDCRRRGGRIQACISPLERAPLDAFGEVEFPETRRIGQINTASRRTLQAFLDATPGWDVYQLLEPFDGGFIIAGLISPFLGESRVVMFEDGRMDALDLLFPCERPRAYFDTFQRDIATVEMSGLVVELEHAWFDLPEEPNRIAVLTFDHSDRLPGARGHAPAAYEFLDQRADKFIVDPWATGLEPGVLCREAVAALRESHGTRYRSIGVHGSGDAVEWVLPALIESGDCGADFAILDFGWSTLADVELDGYRFSDGIPVHISFDEERNVEFSLELVDALLDAGAPIDVRVMTPNPPSRLEIHTRLPSGSADSRRDFLSRLIDGPTQQSD